MKKGDVLEIPIGGRRVRRCSVDDVLTLQFGERAGILMIGITGPFRLSRHGDTMTLRPDHPQELGPVLALVGRVVVSATATQTGTLEMVFADGSHLKVEPHERYEAWEFVGERQSRLVCAPGGEVYVWSSKEPATSEIESTRE